MMFSGFRLLLGFALAVNAADAEGCMADDKSFKVGEQYNVPGTCASNVCMDNGNFSKMACGVVGVPAKWVVLPEDSSKPYPDCCSRAVPPLRLIPDVVDKMSLSQTLQVTYEGGSKVDLGNELTPTQVKSEPTVCYKADPNSYYLLCMTNPDVPTRQEPTSRELHHWLVGNIPCGDVARGDVLTEYKGSAPDQGSGLHRYTFVLYKQPGKLTFDEPHLNTTQVEERRYFSIKKFAAKYNLGYPVAINVFQSQYEG